VAVMNCEVRGLHDLVSVHAVWTGPSNPSDKPRRGAVRPRDSAVSAGEGGPGFRPVLGCVDGAESARTREPTFATVAAQESLLAGSSFTLGRGTVAFAARASHRLCARTIGRSRRKRAMRRGSSPPIRSAGASPTPRDPGAISGSKEHGRIPDPGRLTYRALP
jgi:hypothetical protein